ncbi:MAG: T9SS type A sorting domain-containing protein [Flavobacteriales bacterium]|nr:T9SS type A sorting domain-containing protein [Flavobacteriales bacterium]
MKKTLLLTFTVILIQGFMNLIQAQCSPDMTYTVTGAYPNPIVDGAVNVSYTDTVTLVFPDDTTISGFTLALDSAIIDSVTNLPAGLTSTCMTANCTSYLITPGQPVYSCLEIHGTPTVPVTGQTFDINVTFYTTFFGQVQSISQTLNSSVTINQSVSLANLHSSSDLLLFPNPSLGNITINAEDVENVQIFNVLGEQVFNNDYNNASNIELDLTSFSNGTYMTIVKTGSETYRKKLILE